MTNLPGVGLGLGYPGYAGYAGYAAYGAVCASQMRWETYLHICLTNCYSVLVLSW